MTDADIVRLINSEEPIAIVRYVESAVFSDYYISAKYSLLRINGRERNIEEVRIPHYMVSYIITRLDSFELVFREDDGAVWERMSFRDRVMKLIPRWKINKFNDKK